MGIMAPVTHFNKKHSQVLSHSEFRVSIIWTKKWGGIFVTWRCTHFERVFWVTHIWSCIHFILNPELFILQYPYNMLIDSHLASLFPFTPRGVMPSVPFSHNYRILPGRRKQAGCVTKVDVMPCQLELIRLWNLFALVVHPSSLPTCSGFSIIILRTVPCKGEKK